MKTPMQELRHEIEVWLDASDDNLVFAYKSVLEAIDESYLNKEKEVMCDFVEYCDEANRNYQDTEESWCEDLTIDDMFDKRFNNK